MAAASDPGAPARPPATGFLGLFAPKLRIRVNRLGGGEGRVFRGVLLGLVGTVFWGLVFAVIFRMLLYFRGTQGIGDLLAAKLLGLAFVTFLMILVLSNLITALSTFFLSEDLEMIVAAPVDGTHLYAARLAETLIDSSWMVVLMAIPILAAYGAVYGAGWGYVGVALATLLPLLVIPAVVGSALTLILVNVFPARRTRDLLALLAVVAAAGLLMLFRFLRPERLMRPEEFRDLVDFMAVLRTPASPWLPSQWAADALMGHLNATGGVFSLGLLWSTAAAFFVLGALLHGMLYGEGFSKAQEGAERRDGRRRGRALERLLGGLGPRPRGVVLKEVRTFFRDTTQWSQLILLAVLVVVYVYNIGALPLYTGEEVSFLLVNIVSFLNLGLAGFVVAAIAARFVFPAMSLEGRVLWLLRSSPLDVRTLFWAKYWVGTLPLLVIAVPLIVVTNVVLQAPPLVLAVTTVTMIAVTFALTALALGIGALYPSYETENVAEIPTSFGGLLFMMAAVLYLGGVVVLEGWPAYVHLRTLQAGDGSGSQGAATFLATGLGAAALLTLLAVWLPLRLGIRSVQAAEG